VKSLEERLAKQKSRYFLIDPWIQNETFKAYSSCVDQRSSGAKEAGKTWCFSRNRAVNEFAFRWSATYWRYYYGDTLVNEFRQLRYKRCGTFE
jgi:hypothetical protein